MKELSKEFIGKGEMRGFTFKQLTQCPRAYLYEVTDKYGKLHYEVFERKINDLYQTITYPSSKSFGLWAFSYLNRAKAEDRYKTMSDKGTH